MPDLFLSSAASAFAAVDLGGTNIAVAVANSEGCILAEAKEATRSHEGSEAVLKRISRLVSSLARRCGVDLEAVGIGLPGLVDLERGAALFLPNFPGGWKDVAVRVPLADALGCPVRLLNDARAAALGEWVFGHGQNGVRSLVLLTLGTGVGGGVILDGKLRLGRFGAAGEIGHGCLLPEGAWCGCGSRGCLETLVSGPALTAEGIRLLLSGNAPILYELCGGDIAQVSPKLLGTAARAGEKSVLSVLDRAGRWLGVAAANITVTVHPEMIVVGGGVSALDDLLLDPMRREFSERVRMMPSSSVAICRSKLDDRAGVFGALALAMNRG
jgi:glucokinase